MDKVKVIACDLNISEHRDAFFDLLNMYIVDDMGGGTALPEEKKEKLLNDLQQHPTSLLFLAQLEGKFVGFATCFSNYSTFKLKPYIYIHDIAITPGLRGKGVGKTLLNGIFDKAKEMGCCKVTLEVRNDNLVAQRLYQKMGFDFCDPKMLYWEKSLL